MDKGQTNNPNVTSRGYQMKFWGLLAMVAHIANTTQQKSMFQFKEESYNPNGPRTSLQLKT